MYPFEGGVPPLGIALSPFGVAIPRQAQGSPRTASSSPGGLSLRDHTLLGRLRRECGIEVVRIPRSGELTVLGET